MWTSQCARYEATLDGKLLRVGRQIDTNTLPLEFCLREFLERPASAELAAEFTETWGLISQSHWPNAADPYSKAYATRLFDGDRGIAVSYRGFVQEIFQRDMAEAGRMDMSAEVEASYIAIGQSLVKHWVNFRRGLDVREAWPWWEYWRALFKDLTPWHVFEDFLNAGLRPFSPRIWTVGDDAENPPASTVPLYSAVLLQLYELISRSDEDVAHQCQNANCRVWFFRQRGRAEKGQHKKSGVLYCSASCALATAKRASRARKASSA